MQSVRKAHERIDGWGSDASFKQADMVSVKAGFLGHLLLRHVAFLTLDA
jgi:hypothetical protein